MLDDPCIFTLKNAGPEDRRKHSGYHSCTHKSRKQADRPLLSVVNDYSDKNTGNNARSHGQDYAERTVSDSLEKEIKVIVEPEGTDYRGYSDQGFHVELECENAKTDRKDSQNDDPCDLTPFYAHVSRNFYKKPSEAKSGDCPGNSEAKPEELIAVKAHKTSRYNCYY